MDKHLTGGGLFYVAKGFQIAGLIGVGAALYVGVTRGDAMMREIGFAVLGMAFFYTGRLVESWQRSRTPSHRG